MFDEDGDDGIIIYGTPLPPLEDNENASKKPEIDLTVRDWKGRRRFHGAFTGGFSAGYFNSVDTEKGWIPSQYVSKKGERWDKKLLSNKPEDFMDEEDFSLFGIAPKKVHTKDNFKGPEPEAFAGLRDSNASLIDVLRDIIKPTNQSIGVKLFTIMKKGRKYKGAFIKPKTNAKVYGCSMPPQFSTSKDDNENDSDGESIIRPEIFSLPYKPKNDFHGIGYKSLKSIISNEKEESIPIAAVLGGNKRLMISGEAFGYGALEEDDDDYAEDAMVYSKVDLSKYDFEIGSVKKIKPEPSTSAIPSNRKGILEGFTLAARIESIYSSKSKLPDIPRNWKPHPPFLKSKRTSRWNQSSSSSSITTEEIKPTSAIIEQFKSLPSSNSKPVNRSKPLDANTRAVLLGEEVDIVVGIKKPNESRPSTITSESEVKKSQSDRPVAPSHPMSAFFSNRFVQSSELEEEKLKPGLVEAKSINYMKPKSTQEDELNDESKVGTTKRETFQWHPHTLLSKRFNVPHPYPQFPDVVGIININRDQMISDNKKIPSSKPNIFSSLIDSPTVSSTPSISKTETNTISRPSSSSTSIIEKNSEEIPEKIERPPLDLFKAIFASDESESDDEDEDEDAEKKKKKDENKDKEKEKIEIKSTINPTSSEKDELKESSKATIDKSINLSIVSRDQVIQPQPSTSKAGIFSGLNLDLINKKISYALPTKDHGDSDNDNIALTLESQVMKKDKQDVESVDDSYGPVLPPDNLSTSYEKSNYKKKDKKRKKSKSKSKSKHKSKKSKSKHRRRSTSSESDSDESDSSDSDEIHAKRHKSSHHSKRST